MTLSEKDLLAKVPTGLYIGGKWVQGHGASAISVEDPATGKPLIEIANANSQDGLAALTSAFEAQSSWAKVAPRERGELLRRTFELVRERSEEFATLISLEMGKPIAEARGEVAYGNEFLRWFAERQFESLAATAVLQRAPAACSSPTGRSALLLQSPLGTFHWPWPPERLAQRLPPVAQWWSSLPNSRR